MKALANTVLQLWAALVALVVALMDPPPSYVHTRRHGWVQVPAGGAPGGLLEGLGLGGGLGRLGSRIQQNILGVPPGEGTKLPPPVRRTLVNSDFMDIATPTDITTVALTYTTMGDGTDDGFAVPAQQGFRWGYGQPSEGSGHNQGYIYLRFIDDTAGDATNEDGRVRFLASDANQIRTQMIFEERTEELDGDANDINQRIPLPEQGPILAEADLMIIQLRADAVDTVQPDFSTIRIPCTLYQPYVR